MQSRHPSCPGYTDRRETTKLGDRLERFIGRLAETQEGQEELHRLSLSKIRDLMDGKKEAKSLKDLVTEFQVSLENKGTLAESIKTKVQRVQAVIDFCEWKWPDEIREDDVLKFIGDRRRKKMARRTCNHYMAAIKQFAKWFFREKSPISCMVIPDVRDNELVHVRRVLTEEEFIRLLKAAETSTKKCFKLSGVDRMVAYVVAAYTGFRAKELHSMTPANLALLAETPTASVLHTKNGKAAENPLSPELARMLLPWVEGKPKDVPLWNGKTWSQQGSKMLQFDLKAAGIPFKDEQGRFFDFHALRCQFATNLAKQGVHVSVAQGLMRHSRPELTSNIYTKIDLGPKAAAVNKLPAIPAEFAAKFEAKFEAKRLSS